MRLLSIIFLLVCLVAQAQDNDDTLTDDQSLVDEEFSFSQLFDRKYGLLVGYGGARYRLYVGGSYFINDYLNILLSFGVLGEYQPKEEDNDERERNKEQVSNEAGMMATKVQLRYYPHAKLPLSVFAGAGVARWNGTIESGDSSDKYKIWELYGETGMVVFYFWRGFYVESTILGIVSGHSIDFQSKVDRSTKDSITKEIEQLDQYGMLAGTLNLAVGYFF